jgi:hypothetical protein
MTTIRQRRLRRAFRDWHIDLLLAVLAAIALYILAAILHHAA